MKYIKKMMIAMAARPPTTPPAMAAVGTLEEFPDDELERGSVFDVDVFEEPEFTDGFDLQLAIASGSGVCEKMLASSEEDQDFGGFRSVAPPLPLKNNLFQYKCKHEGLGEMYFPPITEYTASGIE